MSTVYDARSVDPATVTNANIDAVFAECGITKPRAAPDALESFFRANITYRRHGDLFRCRAIGVEPDGAPVALGFMPVNLGGERTWEVIFQGRYDWERGWAAVPDTDGTSS